MGTGKRRLAQGLGGSLLLLATVVAMYRMSASAYYNYYLYPRVKDGYIMPLRWQDVAFTIAFWVVAGVLCFVAYRLVRTGLRG